MFKGARQTLRENKREQSLHDRVIDDLADRIENQRGAVVVAHTNPGQEKNYDVHGLWPDIVVVDGMPYVPEDGPVSAEMQAIWEIETEASTTDAEAKRQWKPFSKLASEYEVPFHLVVPEALVPDAHVLLIANKIEARLWGFRQLPGGGFKYTQFKE